MQQESRHDTPLKTVDGRRHIDTLALTMRQLEVATRVLDGMSNQEIADDLCVCEKTVKFHCTAIFKVAQVKSRGKLIAQFYKLPAAV